MDIGGAWSNIFQSPPIMKIEERERWRSTDGELLIEWHIKCIHFLLYFSALGLIFSWSSLASSSSLSSSPAPSVVSFIFFQESLIDGDQNMVKKNRPTVPVHMITHIPILWLIFICNVCVCISYRCVYRAVWEPAAACRCCLWIILDGLRACMFDCDMIKRQSCMIHRLCNFYCCCRCYFSLTPYQLLPNLNTLRWALLFFTLSRTMWLSRFHSFLFSLQWSGTHQTYYTYRVRCIWFLLSRPTFMFIFHICFMSDKKQCCCFCGT